MLGSQKPSWYNDIGMNHNTLEWEKGEWDCIIYMYY